MIEINNNDVNMKNNKIIKINNIINNYCEYK